MNSENILIIGCGNQGLALAVDISIEGKKVNIWNRTKSHIEDIQRTKQIYSEGLNNKSALINKVSTDIDEVFADFIIVSVPNSGYSDVAAILAKRVTSSTIIVLSPGRTFGAIEFARLLKKYGSFSLPHIFEMQTIIHTARKKSNTVVGIYAYKSGVAISSLHKDDSHLLNYFPDILRKNIVYVDSMAYTSLNNVGMLLHCAPTLMNIGCIESERVSFKYYFDGISESVAQYVEQMDKERLKVAKTLGYHLESVKDWVKRIYKSSGNSLYECLQNNHYYKDIDAPISIHHRYIYEDIPCGLVPIEYLAHSMHLDVPYITLIIDLGSKITGVNLREEGRHITKNDFLFYDK